MMNPNLHLCYMLLRVDLDKVKEAITFFGRD